MNRWVIVFGRVNHLGAEPDTQAYSARAHPLWRLDEYLAIAVGVNRHIAWYTSPYPWSRSVRWMPGWMDWLAQISADLWEAEAHYRRVRDDALYKRPRLLLLNFTHKVRNSPLIILPSHLEPSEKMTFTLIDDLYMPTRPIIFSNHNRAQSRYLQ